MLCRSITVTAAQQDAGIGFFVPLAMSRQAFQAIARRAELACCVQGSSSKRTKFDEIAEHQVQSASPSTITNTGIELLLQTPCHDCCVPRVAHVAQSLAMCVRWQASPIFRSTKPWMAAVSSPCPLRRVHTLLRSRCSCQRHTQPPYAPQERMSILAAPQGFVVQISLNHRC